MKPELSLSPFPIATVGALIFDQAHHILMIQTHKWSHKWGIPGGKIQRGETCQDALKREILEETSLEIDEIQFVTVQDCIDPEEFEKSAHFLLLNYTAKCEGIKPNVILNDEAQRFLWVTYEEARELDLNIPTQVLLNEVFHTQSIPSL